MRERKIKYAMQLNRKAFPLRSRSFFIREEGEAAEVFGRIEKYLARKDRRSISWIKGMVKSHIQRDYSKSALLKSLKVTPVQQFVLLTICKDLTLLIEYSVVASDGNTYERNECREQSLVSFPLPHEIRAACRRIRAARPKSDYAEQWNGFSGSAIREISIWEINECL